MERVERVLYRTRLFCDIIKKEDIMDVTKHCNDKVIIVENFLSEKEKTKKEASCPNFFFMVPLVQYLELFGIIKI